METIKAEIKLYEYAELKDKAKERAFNEHKEFLDNSGVECENEKGELNIEYLETEKEEVEDSLEINKYLFFKDGEMADICHFTGKHKKAGKTEFYFNGEVYNLK